MRTVVPGRRIAPPLNDERGSTIVMVGLAIAGLLSMVALAVDIGMLFNARSEAQRAADAAAMAGAGSLISAPWNDDLAKDEAIRVAGENTVRGLQVTMLREDVDVDIPNSQVTARVRRTEDRGSAIATWFARVFGTDEVDVAATATAEVVVANAAVCVKPFAVPDWWSDDNANGKYDPGEYYDPGVTGYGTDYRNSMGNGTDLPYNGIDPVGTTYTNDFGRPMTLKAGSPFTTMVYSWYFPWDVPQRDNDPIVGADRYRKNIANCNPTVVSVGDAYHVETGNMDGPTRQGIRDLMDMDPNATWDVNADSVVGSIYHPWRASPRFATIPLFDPTQPLEPGKKPIVFNNFTSFWIEGMNGKDVVGRFLFASGIGLAGNPGPGGPGQANQARFVRLIK